MRKFMGGVLLGTALTLTAAFHQVQEKHDEMVATYKEELNECHLAYQANLKMAWDYALEECPALFEENMKLRQALVRLQEEVVRSEVNCLWRMAEERKKGWE